MTGGGGATELSGGRRLVLLAISTVLLVAAVAVAVSWHERPVPTAADTTKARGTATTSPATRAGPAPTGLGPTTSPTLPPRASSTSTSTPPPPAAALGPVALTGCPPSRKPPPVGTPGHPSVLVPESALPTPPAPQPRLSDLAVIAGKGMWIWQQERTSGGNVAAIVNQAAATGLHQVWVRVGSSLDGFYGQAFLNALVPAMHAKGMAVIGWGFPYLYDPVADVAWTKLALNWRSTGGERLDGWSADIETGSEGTALSGKRSSTYLGLVRPLMGGRPLMATVYPPTAYWLANYPYQSMAPYIDAFTPMMYWSCKEPGEYAALAIHNLAKLAPVHLIGQAYDMGPYGGRDGSPSGAEIARFLDVARRGGATGASFWVWQYMTGPEWAALTSYRWPV